MKIPDQLANIQSRALRLAQETLKARGFTSLSNQEWEGSLDIQNFGSIQVTVTLPPEFPDSLPDVRVVDNFPTPLPHLEPLKNGKRKVCIGDGEGLFWNPERPGDFIQEALDRVRETIEDGLAKKNHDDFPQEFLAYWNAEITVASILDVNGLPRDVWISKLSSEKSWFPRQLLSNNKREAKAWATNLGFPVTDFQKALYLPLEKPIAVSLEKVETVQDFLSLIKDHGSLALINKILKRPLQLPTVFAISFPLSESLNHVLFGFSIPAPSTRELRNKSTAGFRPNRAPLRHQLRVMQKEPVFKVKFERFDIHYLLGRSGGIMDIQEKKVLVIGCGSVGSRIAEKLASSGITRFCLVDPDEYKNDNVYRHLLPLQFVGMNKAKALAVYLQGRFPGIQCQFHPTGILEGLNNEVVCIDDFDLAIVATGIETLELRLNQLFYGRFPSIFASVEPLGLGGHILLAGVPGQSGCLNCLYQNGQDLVPNRAFFTAPGQDVRRNHAGCGGTFLPFSPLDADRTALESAQLAVRLFLGEEVQSILLSWFGESTAFEKEGFKLSSRGSKIPPRTLIREERHINSNCKVCADQ
ncbi:ThiF family adenylyltransferase [Nitrospina gracilis]|uniref:ThiF family adenylyltransferase n=1 Tax=Nitrospina gracilis TaxID=35801 RepID=UPI001F01F159|nr:ThiF family adenylyltransferase [Nitrospina gracilis]MCF8721777.1 hypothetical protein [Nitrospina gracilis Nb-211]